MDIFNKFENKYYGLLEELLNSENELTEKEVISFVKRNMPDNDKNKDFFKELFGEKDSKDEDSIDDEEKRDPKESGIYNVEENGKIRQKMGNGVPILLNNVEKQAIYSLASKKKAPYFLEEKTIEKIKSLYKEDTISIWDEDYIKIKNQDKNGDTGKADKNGEKMRKILSAIINKKSIRYHLVSKKDNSPTEIREDYPYKIEYSLAKDKFVVIAYREMQDRFIRIELDDIDKNSLEIGEKNEKLDLDDKFERNENEKQKTLILSVSSKFNTVERCFSIFSHYERKTTLMKDKGKEIYILEIKYNEADQPEIINDIISLGDKVLVLEPENIRNIVIEKVRKCVENYENI